MDRVTTSFGWLQYRRASKESKYRSAVDRIVLGYDGLDSHS